VILAVDFQGGIENAWSNVATFVPKLAAALDQLQVAPRIVTGLWYAILAAVVGSVIVAVGGGGIRTMQRYWDRMAGKAEERGPELRQQAQASAAQAQSDQLYGDGRTAEYRPPKGPARPTCTTPAAGRAPVPAGAASQKSVGRRCTAEARRPAATKPLITKSTSKEQDMPDLDTVRAWQDRIMVDADGDRLGNVESILRRRPDRRAAVGPGQHRPVRYQVHLRAPGPGRSDRGPGPGALPEAAGQGRPPHRPRPAPV
jgi:hypothetical protein